MVAAILRGHYYNLISTIDHVVFVNCEKKKLTLFLVSSIVVKKKLSKYPNIYMSPARNHLSVVRLL